MLQTNQSFVDHRLNLIRNPPYTFKATQDVLTTCTRMLPTSDRYTKKLTRSRGRTRCRRRGWPSWLGRPTRWVPRASRSRSGRRRPRRSSCRWARRDSAPSCFLFHSSILWGERRDVHCFVMEKRGRRGRMRVGRAWEVASRDNWGAYTSAGGNSRERGIYRNRSFRHGHGGGLFTLCVSLATLARKVTWGKFINLLTR